MTKKLLVAMLAIAMAFCLVACGSSSQSESTAASDAESEAVVGGWEMAQNEAAALPEEVQAAFDKAVEAFDGSDLKPVAYVANQVVAGTNYMILCEATTVTAEPVTSYKMVVVYADLEGNAEITSVADFDVAKYLEEGTDEGAQEQLAGGWSAPDEIAGSAIPAEAKAAFDKALEGFTGSDIEPIALLETQVVAGTNYAFICRSTPVVQNPVPKIQVVTVYADLEGDAEISSICTVDPADFNE